MMEYVWPIQNGQSASMLSRWYLSYSFCRFGALKGGTQGYFQSLLRNKQKVWGQRLTLCMHAFYSDDSSLNTTEDFSFYSVNCLERTKINEKEDGDGPLK